MGWPVVGFQALSYGLAYAAGLLTDLLEGEGVVALVVPCWAVDLSHLAVGELVMAWAGYPIGELDASVDEDDVGMLQTMSAALCDLDEVYFFFDAAPDIGWDVRNIDLFGQLNHQWQHFSVYLCLKGFISLHEFLDPDQWEAVETGH